MNHLLQKTEPNLVQNIPKNLFHISPIFWFFQYRYFLKKICSEKY